MARNPVHVRDALPQDAAVLVGMWRQNTETSSRLAAPRVDAAQRAIGHLALDPDQRLVVAEVHDEVVGVAHLVRAPWSPIHEETTVRVSHLFVDGAHRRRGVGRALLAAATTWADEKQIGHLAINVSASARDANRFLARLALGPHAVLRLAPTAVVQAKLDAQAPGTSLGNGRSGTRQLTHVLAARRLTRRAQRHRVANSKG